jgi:hypothetical protein
MEALTMMELINVLWCAVAMSAAFFTWAIPQPERTAPHRSPVSSSRSALARWDADRSVCAASLMAASTPIRGASGFGAHGCVAQAPAATGGPDGRFKIDIKKYLNHADDPDKLGTPNSSPVPRTKISLDYQPVYEGGTPVVRLEVDKGTFGTFGIDTGSSVNMISDRFAARLNLKSHALIGDDGKPFFLEPGKIAVGGNVTLKVGPVEFDGPVVIVSSKRLSAMSGMPIDGIIGNNLLSQTAVLFDFQKRHITLWYPGGLTPTEIAALGMIEPTTVKLVPNHSLDSYLSVRLNDELTAELALDTGAGTTTIPYDVAAKSHLKPIARGIVHPTLFGNIVRSQAVLDRVTIGSIVLTNQPVEYGEHEIDAVPPRIGMDILGRFQLLIDHAAGNIYFARPTDQRNGNRTPPVPGHSESSSGVSPIH